MRAIYSCPLDETKIAALDLHDDIQERAETVYNPFVLPIIVFPDMERNEAIDNLAQRKGVYRFGAQNPWLEIWHGWCTVGAYRRIWLLTASPMKCMRCRTG